MIFDPGVVLELLTLMPYDLASGNLNYFISDIIHLQIYFLKIFCIFITTGGI